MIPNPEKENAPMNTVGSNGKKAKSSKKGKELAKKKATEDTAISFFKRPGSSLLSLTNQNCFVLSVDSIAKSSVCRRLADG